MFWRTKSSSPGTLPAITISLEHAKSITYDYADTIAKLEGNICRDEIELPHSKRLIKHAIKLWIENENDPSVIELLKANYLILANFLPLSGSDKYIIDRHNKLLSLIKSDSENIDLLKESDHIPYLAKIRERYDAEHATIMSELNQLKH